MQPVLRKLQALAAQGVTRLDSGVFPTVLDPFGSTSGGGGEVPYNQYHEIDVDVTSTSTSVNNWVAKFTEREMPLQFWTNATATKIMVRDQNDNDIPTFVSHFDSGNQKVGIYAKVPTMVAGQVNKFKIVYAEEGQSNTDVSVFSDYLAVIDIDHDVSTELVSGLTAVDGSNATRPDDSFFTDDYYYYDISAHAADLGSEAQITAVFEQASTNVQGDLAALREGSSGGDYMTYALGQVSNMHLQSYKQSSWINGESDGQVVNREQVYVGTVYQSQLANERGTILEGVENVEAAGAVQTLYDRFAIGNAGDRTSSDYKGWIYDLRLSKVVDKDRAHMDSYGLHPDNMTVTVPQNPDIPASAVFWLNFDGVLGSTVMSDGSTQARTLTTEGGGAVHQGDGTILFDGVDDAFSMLHTDDIGISNDNDIAFEVEFQYDSSGDGTQSLFNHRDGSSAEQYRMTINGGKIEFITFRAGSADVNLVGTTNLVNGTWYNFKAQRTNGQDWEIFLDDVSEGTDTEIGNPSNNNAPLWFGKSAYTSGRRFKGLLRKLAIYDAPIL